MSFATSDNGVSEALGLEQHQARVSDGLDAEVPTESLAVASTLGTDITALALHKDMRDISNGVSGTNAVDMERGERENKTAILEFAKAVQRPNETFSVDV